MSLGLHVARNIRKRDFCLFVATVGPRMEFTTLRSGKMRPSNEESEPFVSGTCRGREISFSIYAGSSEGLLYAVNSLGTKTWSYPATGERIVCTPPSIGNDDTIYLGTNDGRLVALYPDGTERWSLSVSATPRGALSWAKTVRSTSRLAAPTCTQSIPMARLHGTCRMSAKSRPARR